MADDVDAAVSAAMQAPPDPATAARAGMSAALGTNPDLYAELRRVSAATGVPIGASESHPEVVKREATMAGTDFDGIAATAPSTAALLADVERAKLGHDDVGNLSAVERAVRSFGSTAADAARYVFSTPDAPRGGLIGDAAPMVRSLIGAGTFGVTAGIYGVGELGARLLEPLGAPLAGTVLPENPISRIAQGLHDARVSQEQGQKIVEGDQSQMGFYEKSIASGFSSTGQMVPGIVASILTGNPEFALLSGAGLQGSQSGTKALDAGKTPYQALAYAVPDAFAEYATEMIPMHALFKDLKAGAPLLQVLGHQALTEVPSEIAATAWQNFNEWASLNNDQPISTYINSLPEAEAQTVIATLVTTALTAGFGHAVNKVANGAQIEQQRAQQAEQSAGILKQIMDFAAASKVRERDANTFENFMQSVTQDGPLEKVYVNPKDLEKAGINLAQMSEVAPSAAEHLAQAYQTGSDAALNTSELAARLPGSTLEQSLLQHLKTDPEGFSQAGAAEYMQTQGEAVRQTVEKVLGEKGLDDTFKTSMKQVEDDVLRQLRETNRFTDDVNAPYAALWSSFFGVQAARLGTMPQDLYQRFAPRVVANAMQGPVLEQRGPEGDVTLPGDIQASLQSNGQYTTVYGWSSTDAAKSSEAIESLRKDGRKVEVYIPPGKRNPMRAFWNKMLAEGKVDRLVVDDGISTKNIERERTDEELGAQYAQQARGSFNPATNTVALLKAADLSTFLHESGHFFLEVMADLAEQPDAPQQIKDDFATFLKWSGVEGGPEAWAKMTLEEKRAHHEDFARGFEAYLFEGKAPSIELQGVFQRFRAWLLNVYRTLAGLNVNLNSDIRQVFDRMLASTEQIKLAEDVRGFDALFKNKPEGMTADEWAVYQVQANDATQQAVTELESRSLRDMKWLSNAKGRELKKLQREAAKRRGEIEAEVRKEVEALPVYKAIAAIKELRKSDPQDRAAAKAWGEQRDAEAARVAEAVKSEYLASEEGAATKGIERGQYLARNKRAMANEVERRMIAWERENPRPKVNVPDADLEAVAALNGFTSADHLRKAISEAQPLKEVVEGMTDQRMLERHADLVDERSIEAAAERAIHNDARLRFTATETNALRKAIGQPALLAKAVRQFASDMIARTKVRDLRPAIYTAAEKRAAVDAAKAAAANKLEDAAIQKRNQLINGYAAQAALNAQDEVGKIVDYLGRFNKESVYKSLDPEYIEQIHNMLARFDLRTGQSMVAIDKRTSLANWLKSQEEAGLEPDIPQELADEAFRTHYKNLTVEQLRGLRDTVKQIEHLGRLKHKLLTAKDQRDYEAVRDTIVSSILDNAGDQTADNRTRPTTLDAAIRMFNGYLLEHRKVASLARELDGFKDGGAMWEYIVRTMNDAGDKEATMRADAAHRLAELAKPITEGEKRGGKGEFFPAVGKSFNREERLGIALNMGNEGNLQRLLDGEGWTLAQVKTITDTLTEADWHFVQGVWDFLESYRPLVGAKEKRVYGKEPAWIEPQPLKVQTADGKTIDLRGGYYPVKYDTAQSGRAEAHADAELAKQQMRGAYTSATTRRSFTKNRAEEVKGRPLMYSTDALFNGVNEIIHDLSWHEWLIDANRLMRSKSIDNAIRSRYGAQVMQQFKSAIKDIAAGEFPATHALERVSARLRAGTVIAGLGLNIMNSVINVQGFTQSMVRLGPKWSAVGLGKYASNPRATVREVMAKSDLMANRAKTLNREVNEIQSLVRDKSATRQVVDRIVFMPLELTQQVVDTPTWWGAYQKALDEGHDEDRAVALADQTVIDTQSGGQVKDLAKIQRGGPFLKLWTTFYGFFSSTYNLSVESTKATNFKDPLQVVKLAGDYMLLWTIPALMGTLMKNLFTGGDWDPDKMVKQAAGDQISYLMGFMVGLREFAAAAQAVTGTSQFNTGYGGPAGARFIGEVTKLATQVHQGEIDAAFLKSLNNVLGIMTMYPASQINRTAEGAIALHEGRTHNPLALLAGPPPKLD